MAKGYSVDLRKRVIAALARGGLTDEEAAQLFQIGEATVHRWKRLKRETGALEPRPYGGGYPPRISAEQEEIVRQMVAEQPDLTDQEAAWEYHRRTGTSVSRATMGRTLRKLGLTRKKRPSPPPSKPRRGSKSFAAGSSKSRRTSTRGGSSSSTRRAATSR
jgi:transposase